MMTKFSRHANLLVLLILQILVTLKMWQLENWRMQDGLWALGTASFSVALMVLLWNMLIAHLPRRLSLPLNIVFVVGYLMLQAYHWLRHEPLTFLIVYKNGHDLLTPEAIGFVFGSVTPLGWACAAAVILAAALLQRKFDIFGASQRLRHRMHTLAIVLLANIGLVVAAPSTGNEYYEFARSVYRYVKPMAMERDIALYPYLKSVPSDEEINIAGDADRPHVFIVMLESFSALYMDRMENGKRVTPFLDELKDEGLFVQNFYSASVETSKGQFATLCSVYPAYRANVFTRYHDNHFRCLSHILRENGYTNVFMKAFHSLGFENTGNFVRANAFDYAHGMDDTFVTAEERKRYKFGWGIQDDIFYRKTFNYLDQLYTKHGLDTRFFVTTMSVTNHMMFDDIPIDQRFIYPDAKTHHENYSNSMHLTDKYLREFFRQLNERDYLDNSLVLVLGDNGFPMGQHNNYHNTKTGYNELFRMPLLILWNGEIEPEVLDDRAYSQQDVAPTLLDLLGIKTTHHFVGQSIFDIDSKSHFVPLIQPFDGTWLSSIRYPYKLMQHLKTGREFLYDIKQDPTESVNLMDANIVNPALLSALRRDIATIKLNEVLLEEDRIFPAGVGDSFRIRIPNPVAFEGEPLQLAVVGEIDEHSYVQATVKSIDSTTGRWQQDVVEVRADDVNSLPPHLLRPGINRIKLRVRRGDQTLQTVTRDVYVESDATELLTNLPQEGHQGWGSLGINRSVGGRELTIKREEFGFGLGTHAPSEHRFLLGGDFKWFHTQLGLDHESRCGDGAIFEIWADGARLYASKPLKHDEVKSAWVKVAGYSELRLVTRARKSKNCDHTNWLNPVLFR